MVSDLSGRGELTNVSAQETVEASLVSLVVLSRWSARIASTQTMVRTGWQARGWIMMEDLVLDFSGVVTGESHMA